VSSKTPSEIYRELRDFPEGKLVTRHQVYYIWQKANAEIWQRDSDPFVSATMLLSEDRAYRDHHGIFTAGNVRALGFFAPEPIKRVAKSATQLVMDATFGTNSGGMDLFAVLAEIEGTGVPLAYCLVEILKPPQGNSSETKPLRADPGAMTYVIQQFLERLKGFGLHPRCFAIDKDAAEIAAVTCVAGYQNSAVLLACEAGRKHEVEFIQKHQHAKPLPAGRSAAVDSQLGDLLGLLTHPPTAEPSIRRVSMSIQRGKDRSEWKTGTGNQGRTGHGSWNILPPF
jgi:hypothetical protein